ncbi:glycosyl hydrolase family 43, partial [bacterium]
DQMRKFLPRVLFSLSLLSALSCSPDVQSAEAGTTTFTNPILPAPSADPWMVRHNGRYYLSESHDNAIIIRSSERAYSIVQDPGKQVWHAPATGPNCDEIWAPELHQIGNRWYIYFAADDGKNENHRMWVLSSAGDDPLGPYDSCAQLATGGWAIDGTVLNGEDGKLYFIWSGWPGKVDGMQQLYIAPMESPVKITASRTLLTTPTQPWERQAMPICEGPEILNHAGKVFLVYSASGSWTRHYCLGMLVNEDGQFLNPSSWTKMGPVFTGADSVFGVGHCSFIPSPDGMERWIIYHAKEKSTDGWEDRSVRMQKFTWDGAGYPQFGKPVAPHVPLPIPSEGH